MRTSNKPINKLIYILILGLIILLRLNAEGYNEKPKCFINAKLEDKFGTIKRHGVPHNLYSAWQECLKALELKPNSEKILGAIKKLKKEMLISLDLPYILEGRSLTIDRTIHNELFNIKTFPKEGIVSKDNAFVYNESLLKTKELPKGKKIKLTRVYPYAFSNELSATGVYHYFYTIEGDTVGLISTTDVAIEEKNIDPVYMSPDKEAVILRTPVTYYHMGEALYTRKRYHLWLKTEDGKLVFLNDYFDISDEPEGDYPESSYKFEHPISWSPDSKYLFVECSGKVFSKDGELIFDNNKYYTSPFWYGGYLYVRGIEKDDSVIN